MTLLGGIPATVGRAVSQSFLSLPCYSLSQLSAFSSRLLDLLVKILNLVAKNTWLLESKREFYVLNPDSEVL